MAEEINYLAAQLTLIQCEDQAELSQSRTGLQSRNWSEPSSFGVSGTVFGIWFRSGSGYKKIKQTTQKNLTKSVMISFLCRYRYRNRYWYWYWYWYWYRYRYWYRCKYRYKCRDEYRYMYIYVYEYVLYKYMHMFTSKNMHTHMYRYSDMYTHMQLS